MRDMKITDFVWLVLFLVILQSPCSCLESTIDTTATCTSLFVKPELSFDKIWSGTYGTPTAASYPIFYTIERLQKIYIRSGSNGTYINAVKFVFTNGIETPYYGNSTLGNQYIWTVPDCENVVQLNIRSGGWMDSLQFVTNKGTISPVYGGQGGQPYKLAWDVTGGIHGFRASTRYNTYVGSLSFYLQRNWI